MNLKHLCAAALASLLTAGAQATAVRLEAVSLTVQQGTPFVVRIVADIDAADEIIGFGFDVNLTSGVRLLGFSPGPGFADDPIYLAPFSDGDGIRGASGGDLLTGPPVSGLNILLGLLRLQANDLGVANIGLGADDLSFNFTEGLIPASINSTNFMPAVTPLALSVQQAGGGAPEPGSLACAALALGLLFRSQRRNKR
jgi:MYXO-CTERM domain-containing protein